MATSGSKIARILDRPDASIDPTDMALPGYYLYQLSGQENYAWSVRVSGNWRFTFLFEGEDVIKPLGFTITEAAQKLGVSRKTLSKLVNQKSSLSPEMALRISEARLEKQAQRSA